MITGICYGLIRLLIAKCLVDRVNVRKINTDFLLNLIDGVVSCLLSCCVLGDLLQSILCNVFCLIDVNIHDIYLLIIRMTILPLYQGAA